jgi:hypothetical protein
VCHTIWCEIERRDDSMIYSDKLSTTGIATAYLR